MNFSPRGGGVGGGLPSSNGGIIKRESQVLEGPEKTGEFLWKKSEGRKPFVPQALKIGDIRNSGEGGAIRGGGKSTS